MVLAGVDICPDCGGDLKYYDTVRRLVKRKYGRKTWIFLERKRCVSCGRTHRIITDEVVPFKHYERAIIEGVLDGLIFSDTFGFEDFPCELTMVRWRSRKIHPLV